MAPFWPADWQPPPWYRQWTPSSEQNELGRRTEGIGDLGAIPSDQAHVILIVAITSATVSLILALNSFRWFAMMKRSYRHHLIMLLMLSDSFKALWYLIFPLVVFTRGPVNSSSDFCQAGGFFLAFATEASDFAILTIAAHLMLCVFGPQKPRGESGLWAYRRWVYPVWIALPMLAASLAFTNSGDAYVTHGTFCYLPKQPLWYRLALAWIPRYIIFFVLFSVGSAITIHVHLKFKRFSLLGANDLSYGDMSRRTTLELQESKENSSRSPSSLSASQHSMAHIWQHVVHRDHHDHLDRDGRPIPHSSTSNQDWANFGFGSTVPLTQSSTRTSHMIGPADVPPYPDSTPVSRTATQTMPLSPCVPEKRSPFASRKQSRVSFAFDTHQTSTRPDTLRTDTATEELDSSRHAIERHLRLLFIWPMAYTCIWIFPFISQCLQYTDRYALHQPYWLTITVTAILALQAGVDALVFTLREQPWKRPRGDPIFSVRMLQRIRLWSQSSNEEKGKGRAGSNEDSAIEDGDAPSNRTSVNWWEEEGRKRKDSIWMGTDTLYVVKSRQEGEEAKEETEKDAAKETQAAHHSENEKKRSEAEEKEGDGKGKKEPNP